MKTLVLDPDSVRAVLEPSNNPRSVVWMVTVRGEIIVNSLDEGWLRYIPPKYVSDRKWSFVIREAAEAIRYRYDSAMAIYNKFLENTDPGVPFSSTGTIHVRKKFPNLHVVEGGDEKLPTVARDICPECEIAVVASDFAPYCGPVCESKVMSEGTQIKMLVLPDDQET